MGQKRRVLVWIVSFLLISGFIATSLASYYVSRSSLRSQISQKELPLTSDNIYSEIQRDLLRPIFISSVMANDTFLRDWVLNGEVGDKKITRFLNEIQKKYKTFTSFFVSEKTKTYYHANGILKKVKQGEQRDEWYFRVREMPMEYEINVDPDMANKDLMTIFINFKVYDYDQRFIGATGVGLKVGAVKELIKKYQKSYDRNIYFVDKTGAIVLHGSSLTKSQKKINDIDGMEPLKDKILSGKTGSYSYKTNGHTVHLNTRYIPEFDWHLLVEQTEEHATRPILNALLVNLGICALITAIVLVLTQMTISSYQDNLEKMATVDKLTGIYNRQAFDIIIKQVLKDVQRKDMDFSIILFDIDHFKRVNDQYGHLVGDIVLKKIIATVSKTIRESDILCRWGGEEFLVLLRKCNLDDAYLISEKIRKEVEQAPAIFEGKSIFSSISLGVSQYHSLETEDSLLSRVDKLLYKAKEGGRNRSEKDIPQVS